MKNDFLLPAESVIRAAAEDTKQLAKYLCLLFLRERPLMTCPQIKEFAINKAQKDR